MTSAGRNIGAIELSLKQILSKTRNRDSTVNEFPDGNRMVKGSVIHLVLPDKQSQTI